jgi:hypothetical protein
MAPEEIPKPGTKVTLTCKGIYEIKGTIMDVPEKKGYIIKGGGWSLFGNEDWGDKPYWKVMLRPYKQKYFIWVGLDSIISCKVGWK